MFVEGNITIDVESSVDIQSLIQQLESAISSTTGKATHIKVVNIDDPISTSKINYMSGV